MRVIRSLCSPRNHRDRSRYGSIAGKGEGMAEPPSCRGPLGSDLAVPWGQTPRSYGRDIHGFLPIYPSLVDLVAVTSNSRSLECHSSWFAHFDSDSLNRHHPDVEKGLRYGLQGPEPARFWRSPAGFGT